MEGLFGPSLGPAWGRGEEEVEDDDDDEEEEEEKDEPRGVLVGLSRCPLGALLGVVGSSWSSLGPPWGLLWGILGAIL